MALDTATSPEVGAHDKKRSEKPTFAVVGDSLTQGYSKYLGGNYKKYYKISDPSGVLLTKYSYANTPDLYSKGVEAYFIWFGTNNGTVSGVKHDLKAFVNNVKEHNPNASFYFGTIHKASSGVPAKDINAAIRDAASDVGAQVIPVDEAYTSSTTSGDGYHLTEAGYQKVANMVKKALNSGSASALGVSVGASSVSSDTQQAQPKRSFSEVKKYIDPDNLELNQLFNPPLPNKVMLGTDLYPNRRGFIVRDPIFQKQMKSSSSRDTESWLAFQNQWGLKFLYNPTDFAESFSVSNFGDPYRIALDIATGAVPVSASTGATINFELFLSRFEDMHALKSPDWASRYPPGSITETQRQDILNRGTQADLEYLFRLCNGDPKETWTGNTADWGYILPTMCIVSLGNSRGSRKIRAYLSNVGWSHMMFIEGMIPVYTKVSLSFARVIDAYYEPDPVQTSSTGSSSSSETVGASVGASAGSSAGGDLEPARGQSFSDGVVPKNWKGRSVRAILTLFHNNENGLPGNTIPHHCLWYAQEAAGYSHLGGNCPDCWNNYVPESRRHRDRKPPPGAILLYSGGSAGDGHAVVYMGGGKSLGTDMNHKGEWDTGNWSIFPSDSVEKNDGSLHYLGWYEPP